jgi:hypothetical protein
MDIRHLVVAAAAALCAACAGPLPVRTVVDAPSSGVAPATCNPSAGSVDAACAHRAHEHASECISDAGVRSDRGYDLHFVEVDDQGALYPREATYGEAHRQLDAFVATLRDTIERKRLDPATGGVSVAIFVHGWKHDASTDDDNVRKFRSFLCALAEIERHPGNRAVVGLYFAWDAKRIPVDSDNGLLNVTFWDRERAADRIAQGVIRELLARVRSIEAEANREWQQRVRQSILEGGFPSPSDKPPMRFLLMGHSFGARIVFEALSNTMIRDIVDLQHADEILCLLPRFPQPGCGRATASDALRAQAADPALAADVVAAGLVREADMIVLVNPALEATRFGALVDAAHGRGEGADGFPYAHYRAPHVVVIASETDQAVGAAFPAGRALGSLFDRYVGDERLADRTGVGHYLPQVTHRVWPVTQACPGQAPLPEPAECRGWQHPDGKLAVEARLFEAFQRRVCPGGSPGCAAPDGRRAYPRAFCAAPALVLQPYRDAQCTPAAPFNPNNPVWVVRADANVIDGHGDIANEQLHALLRQLYLDSLAFRAAPL